ncbi:MAG TPA: long-chain fatty acid--CoA ligase [Myxococcota bacterium]|nr:long-chain fatty acid--CoA ligase [Myxococcota bacterium]
MSGADPARAALDAAVIAWTREAPWTRDEPRFGDLALALFAFQFEHCAPYRRFCEARGRTPAGVRRWQDVPAVPTGAFKELALTSFPRERAAHEFRTSGTSLPQRGALLLDTLDVYEASLRSSFQRGVLPDLAQGARIRFHVLAPSTREAADSSLSHMFDAVMASRAAPGSSHWITGGALDVPRALRELAGAERGGAPVAVCGTSFAFVHLLEELDRQRLRFALPHSARVMETGGFKGRSRSVPRDELYAWIADRLAVPPARIANQYGMTELGSQFYDSVLGEPAAPRRKLAPPWTRVRILDPIGGGEVAPGEVGRIAVLDLANTGSVCALETADLGRTAGDGFEVIGRDAGAEERGCSIGADALLAEARP